MAMSIVWPGATSTGSGMRFCPPIRSPLASTTRYDVFHVHVPEFLNLQTLVNELPGAKTELSGTFRLRTNSIRSQVLLGVGVRVGRGVSVGRTVEVGIGVRVGVKVRVIVGVKVTVGVKLAVGVKVFVGVDVNVNVGRGVRVGSGVCVGRAV